MKRERDSIEPIKRVVGLIQDVKHWDTPHSRERLREAWNKLTRAQKLAALRVTQVKA